MKQTKQNKVNNKVIMTLKNAKRIVIKIGSALIANAKDGTVRKDWLESLAEDIAHLHKHGQEVIIVTSGAVALGKDRLGKKHASLKLEEKQAAAACGQLALIQAYQENLMAHNLSAAQILLTIEDSEDRRRYLNARNTIETLLVAGIIPIINENDTVATAEIRVGDNDRLAARVAQMISADLLILLSDIDGLYTADPNKHDNAAFIEEVDTIDDSIKAMAGGSASQEGSGGMVTKIAAAGIATKSGCHTIVTLGNVQHPIERLENNGRRTLFRSKQTPANARKQWIAHSLTTSGSLTIDEGAVKALKKGKSLLPAGVKSISGDFKRGDAVLIISEDNQEIGRGLSAYNVNDARLIMGRKTSELFDILNFSGRDELVHRNDLILTI